MRCYSSISIFIELWVFFSSPQPWQQKMTNGRPVEILRLRTRLNCKAGFQIDNQITVSLKKLPGPHSLYNAIGKIIVLNEYNIIFFFSPFFGVNTGSMHTGQIEVTAFCKMVICLLRWFNNWHFLYFFVFSALLQFCLYQKYVVLKS